MQTRSRRSSVSVTWAAPRGGEGSLARVWVLDRSSIALSRERRASEIRIKVTHTQWLDHRVVGEYTQVVFGARGV